MKKNLKWKISCQTPFKKMREEEIGRIGGANDKEGRKGKERYSRRVRGRLSKLLKLSIKRESKFKGTVSRVILRQVFT
jgi:hypothetical protein